MNCSMVSQLDVSYTDTVLTEKGTNDGLLDIKFATKCFRGHRAFLAYVRSVYCKGTLGRNYYQPCPSFEKNGIGVWAKQGANDLAEDRKN